MSADSYLAGIMSNKATPADKPDQASVVKPGAIVQMDGVPCGCLFRTFEGAVRHGSETGEPVDPDEPIRECDLHKALRARVAELESRYKLYKHIAKSVRGALDGEHTQRDILKIFDEQVDRAEAAEAREVELAVALERARQHKLVRREFVSVYDPDESKGKAGMHGPGRSSLSLTNDNAMDGRDAIIVREVYETRYEEHEIEDLAKLDALDKEEKEDED